MQKKIINIEYEVAALKVILKSLLVTLPDRQKESALQNINKTISDAYALHPDAKDVIDKTEQYIKKLL